MADAQHRNVSKTAEEASVVKAPEQNEINLFFRKLRVIGVFLVGFAIGMLSLSVFAREFSSPTSLRPSTLATTTDQFLVIAENGSAIIKNHVQATNFVKPAVNTVRRINKTSDIPTKSDFAVEQRVVKPSALSRTTALFAKNSTSSSTSTSSGSGSSTSSTSGSSISGSTSTTSKAKVPDVRVSTPVGVAAIKAPTRIVNITTVMSKNNGTLPTRTSLPLSTTNPKTLNSKKPTVAATKKTKKPIASKKDEEKEESKDEEEKAEKKTDSDEKYTKKLETPEEEKTASNESKDRRLRR